MFANNINTLVIIIGQEIFSIIPYRIKNIAPTEFMILKVEIFFIKKEIIKIREAAYPTHSV